MKYMKIIKFIPIILLIVGTSGLLIVEFLFVESSRSLILTFAVLNVLGLITLALTHKKS